MCADKVLRNKSIYIVCIVFVQIFYACRKLDMWSVYVGKLLSANRSTYYFSSRKKSLANHHMILLDYKRRQKYTCTELRWIPKCFQDEPWLICASEFNWFLRFHQSFCAETYAHFIYAAVSFLTTNGTIPPISKFTQDAVAFPLYTTTTPCLYAMMMMMMCLEYITLLVQTRAYI